MIFNENQNVTSYENETSYENQNENEKAGAQPKTKVMLAWSNGRETHLHPSMMHLAGQGHLKRLEQLKSLKEKLDLGQECYCLKLSEEYECYSDELWSLGLHAESFRMLLYASEVLFATGRRWISRRLTSWHHDNLIQFRWLYRRCRQRAAQDSRLVPLFNASGVKRLYKRMLAEYWGDKDPGQWDCVYHWDGDDPLCD